MTGVARRSFDVVVIGDMRFPGGTSTCIAEQVRAQAAAGYRTGLFAIQGPLLRYPHPFHPAIRDLLDDGMATLLHPGEAVSARLVVAYHPQVFEYPISPAPVIEAERAILVVNHPPVDGRGRPYYDWAAIHRQAEYSLRSEVLWAPVGPKVRQAFGGLAGAPPLHDEDWLEVIDVDAWSTERTGLQGPRPVIGRHSRPDPVKWPENRKALFDTYPDDPDVEVRILGGGTFLEDLSGGYPGNWKVIPFNGMTPRDFLATIDFFVYRHHPDWVEAFGRAIAEAIAAGTIAILPPDFEPLFGPAAEYARDGDVLSLVRRYHADPAAYLKRTQEARQTLRVRFGHHVHTDRLRRLIGLPELAAETVPADAAKPIRVIFLTSNGVGMGHLTRMLAVARRCSPAIQPVFQTMSQAMSVVKTFGYLAEYIPFHSYLRADERIWNHHLRRHLNEVLTFYDANLLIFDGNMAYEGLVGALEDNPRVHGVWCRRGMWRPGTSSEIGLEREGAFHMIVEPGEIATEEGVGLTTRYRDRARLVDPIRLLDGDEFLDRDAARAELGLEAEGEAVLLQMGAGNNVDHGEVRELLMERLVARPGTQVAAAEWLISNDDLRLPEGVTVLRRYPLARHLRAFDFVISAAGYNSFHELIALGMPTVFVPNENPMMDEQVSRADYAERQGLALSLRAHEVYKVDQVLDTIGDQEARCRLSRRCLSRITPNGAPTVARIIEELAHTARADRPRRDLRSQRPV